MDIPRPHAARRRRTRQLALAGGAALFVLGTTLGVSRLKPAAPSVARSAVVLDTVNSLAVPEGWKDVARTLAPHTLCLHYKDFAIKRAWHMMGFICEGTPSGQGQVDTRWLLDTLKASPYDFNVIIELWPPEQASLEDTIRLEQQWAEKSVPYLRQYISQ